MRRRPPVPAQGPELIPQAYCLCVTAGGGMGVDSGMPDFVMYAFKASRWLFLKVPGFAVLQGGRVPS